MQIKLETEEVIGELRKRIGDLEYDLLLSQLLNKKLGERVEKYEQADIEKNAEAVEAPDRRRRKLSAAVESLPGTYEAQTPDETA